MEIRRRQLPAGWYPLGAEQVREEIGVWEREAGSADRRDGSAVAAIAPHAGWYFCGKLAWRAWLAARNADVVVIAGGHVPGGSPFRFINESMVESPFGPVLIEADLRADMTRAFSGEAERGADNTVEVHLPFCAFRFPGKPLLAVRVPNDERGLEAGRFLASWSRDQGKRLFVLGSTDLTHYGDSYDFSPAGAGRAGLDWAKGNDAAITESFAALDFSEALRLGNDMRAACSVGAALCAMSFARESGAGAGRVLGSDSSFRLHEADSFVGYSSVAYDSAL